MQRSVNTLAERIQTLTAEQLAAVDQFVEALQSTDEGSALRNASAAQSEPAFAAIWDNPEDDAYDTL